MAAEHTRTLPHVRDCRAIQRPCKFRQVLECGCALPLSKNPRLVEFKIPSRGFGQHARRRGHFSLQILAHQKPFTAYPAHTASQRESRRVHPGLKDPRRDLLATTHALCYELHFPQSDHLSCHMGCSQPLPGWWHLKVLVDSKATHNQYEMCCGADVAVARLAPLLPWSRIFRRISDGGDR
jgi:hypothetical protein